MTSILVVDDDELFARALARDLKAQSYDIKIANAVDEAWRLLEQQSFDVVLTDLNMSPHSGLELVRAVRKAYPSTGPVLMSGCATVRDYQQAVAAGSVAVLVKPFSPTELSESIQQALTLRTGFRGSVHGLSLTDMLQMFHLGRRTLQIEVLGKSVAYVRMREGEVIDVESDDGNLRGTIALRHLLSREHGLINTGPLPKNVQATIDAPFDFLLMDAIRENDEAGTPHGVHSARPPRVSWDDPPSSMGNTALAPKLSLVPSSERAPHSVVQQAAARAVDAQIIAVVNRWLEPVVKTSPLASSCTVIAVCCSSGESLLLHGASSSQPAGDTVCEVISSAEAVVGEETGFLECMRQDCAVAIGWDREADAAVLLTMPLTDSAESAKFRARTSVLRRVVTKDM